MRRRIQTPNAILGTCALCQQQVTAQQSHRIIAGQIQHVRCPKPTKRRRTG